MNRAGMSVEAEFTDGTAPPFYDHWKHADTVTAGPGSVSGEVTGIGGQGYWYSEVTGNLVAEMPYTAADRAMFIFDTSVELVPQSATEQSVL